MTFIADKAWGFGLATYSSANEILDVWYPEVFLGTPETEAAAPAKLVALAGVDSDRLVERKVVKTEITLDQAPVDTADVYLRLHLLSHRLVKPHGLDLNGIFGLLQNVVWTNFGPVAVSDLPEVSLNLRAKGNLNIFGIDKFPRMVDYVVPTGVRIADADRVRLGAHLAPGTTIMHEGFVNYNAGTLGVSMVEGRISAGVVVADGSDIGGGASIMGTLSGGGKEVISIGKRCLLGANAGLGISLGDDCVVEAGLYLTAGTKVEITTADGTVSHIKAKELSGKSSILFRRNSVTGAVQATPKAGVGIELNSALHKN